MHAKESLIFSLYAIPPARRIFDFLPSFLDMSRKLGCARDGRLEDSSEFSKMCLPVQRGTAKKRKILYFNQTDENLF